MQLSLLSRAAQPAELDFSGVRRMQLSGGAWVERIPGWLSDHVDLFECVRAAADWERHRRPMYDRVVDVPRLVAPLPGEATLRWRDEECIQTVPHEASEAEVQRVASRLRQLSATLSRRYQRALASISVAYYRDGRDSVAYHGDKLGVLRPNTVVAILSVGARRRFLMRPRAGTAAVRARGTNEAAASAQLVSRPFGFSVGEGDLLVLGGSCQETWEHAVPKTKLAGPRIAVMFREALPQPARSAQKADSEGSSVFG